MKLNKKAFTIVELVIVIAVIAILAAVLIPTFASLIKKSQVSNDTALVRYLNEALSLDKADGGEHITMNDALTAVSEHGYLVDRINAKAKSNEILWDSKNDVFCYLNNDKIEYIPKSVEKASDELTAGDFRLWKIYNKTSDVKVENDKVQADYSIYIANQDVANAINGKTLDVGFDAGDATVASISYVNEGTAKDGVILRTNGGALTINAPADVVVHYGSVDNLNIVAVANASYHEFGKVKFVEISTGRYAMEKGAEVSHIHINAIADSNEFAEIIIAKAATVEMPDFSRDDVEIAATGTLVVALQKGTEEVTSSTELDYVWLTKQGVYEQITVSDNKDEAGTNWADQSTNSKDTQEAAKQIANNIGSKATVGEATYDVAFDSNRNIVLKEENTDNVAYTIETTSTGTTLKDGNGDAVVSETITAAAIVEENVEQVIDKATVQTGAVKFAGGTGRENDPYLVSNQAEFENMRTISKYSYFKWVGENVVDASNWSNSNYLVGSFDGNGVTFNKLNASLLRLVWNGSSNGAPANDTTNVYTLKNFTVNANIVSDSWNAVVVRTAAVHNFVMEDVTVHGYIEGSTGVSSFVCFGAGNYDPSNAYDGLITFTNCNSDAVVIAKSGNAVGFVAHAMMASAAGRITLTNSNFTGTLSATAASGCKYICGNWINGTITDDQSATKNTVVYRTSDNGWKYIAAGKTGTFGVTTGTLPAKKGDAFVLDATAGATYAVISMVVSPNPGNMTTTYMTEQVDVADGKVVSETVRYFTVRVNGKTINESGVHGNYFDIVNSSFNGELGSDTIVRITQYNANGGIVSITNISFNDRTK